MDPARPHRRTGCRTFLALVAVSFLVRLVPAVSSVNLTPDAVEYLDVARHTARGEIGAASLKRHYLDDFPVSHSGNGARPPLFPLVAGAVLAATGGSVRAVQVFNALAASLAAGVWYLAFAALFPWRVAAGAALAASFSVWFWGTSVIALTEPLSMLLSGLAARAVASGRWRTARGAAGLGALASLAFLTRRMNGMLFPLLLGLLAIAAWRRGPGAGRRKAAALTVPFLLASAAVLAPFAAKNVRDFGAPFHDPNTAVFRGGAETFDHYSARPPDTLAEYVEGRGARNVARSVARGVRANVKEVVAGPGGLGLLSLALPLALLSLLRGAAPSAGISLSRRAAGAEFPQDDGGRFRSFEGRRRTREAPPGRGPCIDEDPCPPSGGAPRDRPMADAERYSAGVWFLAGLACLNLVAYSLVGFHGYDDPRFILLTTFPLFALCLHAVETWPGLRGALRGTGPGEARAPGAPGDSARPDTAATGKRLHRGRGLLVGLLAAAAVAQGAAAFAVMIRKVPAVTIAGTPVRVLPRALLRYPPAEYDRLLGELARYADGPGEAVATGMPWLVHFFAGGRPTALLPVDLTPETFPEYLARYRVRTVVLDPASLGQERFLRYRGMIEILAAAGDGAVWQSGSFVFYRRDGPGAAVPGEASREVPPGPARTRIPRSIDLLEAAAFRHEP